MRSFHRLISGICSVILLFFIPLTVQAAKEGVSNIIKGTQVVLNAVVEAEDFEYGYMDITSPGSWNLENKTAEGWLEAGVDRASTVYVGTGYDYNLEFEIKYWTHNGTAFVQTTIASQVLNVKYDPTAATYELDRVRYLLPDAHKVTIKLLSVKTHGGTPVAIPANLYIEGSVNVERYRTFDETATPSAPSSLDYDTDGSGAEDELEIKWPYIFGAEEYDLEWAFVNDYGKTGSQAAASANPATAVVFSGLDFTHNCTRVRITDQHYRIPLLMDRGYIIYRVRGVGRGGPTAGDFSKVICGKWSMDVSANDKVSDYTSSHVYYHSIPYVGSITGGHDKAKNWQVTTTFAEEGKKKEVIGYSDGSLRNRQTVTRINSGGSHVLIGETIYDHQGRAAIQTLPAPTSATSLAKTTIKFYPFFNVSGAVPYSRMDFDLDDGSCNLTVEPMDSVLSSNSAGASGYYSAENDLDFSNKNFIPTAKGFPFTMVEYQPDNTNRIRTQTGVGVDHAYGSNHETKYFYGQPEQEQVDRLFANEAGYSQHYKKNMVVDANGQVSVSYLDMQGRVVATSLAGDTANPSRMLALKNPESGNTLISESLSTLTVDLLSKKSAADTDTPLDNNKLSVDGASLTYSAQKVVASAGTHDFDYSITAPSFTTTCSPYNYPPVYRLDIHLRDQCNNEKLTTAITNSLVTTSFTSPYHDGTTLSTTADLQALNLPVGSYTAEKVLRVDMDAVDILAEQYLLDLDTTCLLTLHDFKEYNKSLIDYSNCDISCEECVENLEDELGERPGTAGAAQDEWDAIYEECVAPCKPVTACQVGYEMMLKDVSPYGQYGSTGGDDYHLSVFNTSNVLPPNGNPGNHPDWRFPSPEYKDELGQTALIEVKYKGGHTSHGNSYFPEVTDGTDVTSSGGKYFTKPENLVPAAFLDAWQESWAKSLIKYHPEYQYYKWCDPLSDVCGTSFCYTSDEFDYALMKASTYAEAVACTVGTCTTATNLISYLTNLETIDPFFSNSTSACTTNYGGMTSPCSSLTYTQIMANKIASYNGGMSMSAFAAYTANCGTWYGNNTCSACSSGCPAFGAGGTAQDNQEWNLFKNYYLSEKQKLMQEAADQYMTTTATTTNDYNYCGCIGEDPFIPFSACPQAPVGFTTTWGTEPFHFTQQPCSYYNYSYYKNKARRFGFSDIAPITPSPSSLQHTADYQMYQQTGLCPNAMDVKTLLSDMAGYGITTSRTLLGVQGFTSDLYQAVSGLTPASNSYSQYTWAPTITSNPLLTIQFTGGTTPAGSCTTNVFTLTLPTGHSWNNSYGTNWFITKFTDIQPTGANTFNIKAEIDPDGTTGSAAYIYIIIGGTTSSCVNLTHCTADGYFMKNDCTPSDELRDLAELMNLLSGNSKLIPTGGSEATLTSTPYSIIFNRKLASYLPPASSTPTPVWKWYSVSSTQFTISDPTNYPNDYIQIDFSSGTGIANTNFFANFNKNPNYPSSSYSGYPSSTYNFVTDVNTTVGTGGLIRDFSVGTSTVTINAGSCDYPNNCKTKEHDFRNDLVNLLNGFVSSPGVAPSTTGTVITGTQWFSHAMNNFLSVTNTEKFAAYNPITSTSFNVDIKDKNSESGAVFCNIQLYPLNSILSIPDYTDLNGFFNLVVDENTLVEGKSYEFTITAGIEDGYVALRGKSCFPIKNCKECVPAANTLTVCETAYSDYVEYLEAENLDEDPAFAYPDSVFCNLALEKCWEEYTEYLTAVECTSSTQNTYVSLAQFCQGDWGYCSTTYDEFYNDIKNYIDDCPYIFVSLQDYCKMGIGSTCQGSYIGYFSTCSMPGGPTPVTILEYCQDYPVQTVCKPFPPTVPTYTFAPQADPCSTYLAAVAKANAEAQYGQYIAAIKSKFKKDYIQHCMTQVVETFTMTYTDKEYFFTLYYYDQAGNLVRTIPPAGVTLINLTATSSPGDMNGNGIADGVDIKNTRNGTRIIFTGHKFATTYKYNSLNQLIEQNTPDGGLSEFWYDALGRLVVSQNAVQYAKAVDPITYSYTLYDAFGRTKEVGEILAQSGPSPGQGSIQNQFTGGFLDDTKFALWISNGTKTQVTKTFYDAPIGVTPSLPVAQDNLRNRVSSMAYQDVYNATATTFDHATHYSYDIHGNVKALVQDNPRIGLGANPMRYKNVRYNYDLISGNVKDVIYQQGEGDQYAHRYEYDADNRITNAYTSSNGSTWTAAWDQDAKYFYYPHGPLMRVELGHNKVQGMDYAYTIQGWIKGVNSNSLKSHRDIGKDANVASGNTNQYIGSDEYGYSLGYFAGDYRAIGQYAGGSLGTNDNMFLLKLNPTSDLNTASPNLFNGNIRNVTASIKKFMATSTTSPQAYAYHYDQVNRIKAMKMFNNADVETDNEWNITSQNNTDYLESYKYDHNGNILRLKRNGIASTATAMDDLKYYFYDMSGAVYNPETTTPAYNATNKLAYITDAVSSSNYTDDIDNQSTGNYTYDEIGNLKSDAQEAIGNIEWTVYGKIKKVTRTSGSTKPDLEFGYDASGNRIMKIVKVKDSGGGTQQSNWAYTYYVRDAQGNVMATYDKYYAVSGGNNFNEQIDLKDRHIYGSSRLGVFNEVLPLENAAFTATGYNADGSFAGVASYTAHSTFVPSDVFPKELGIKNYELTNHLGSVLTTVSDRKIPVDNNSDNIVDFYMADVISATDYYSFGMQMPGRVFVGTDTRFGFQGMEKVDEIASNGNHYTTEFREYDPRIGRWWSIDPITKPWESPYAAFANNPIYFSDPTGLDPDCPDCGFASGKGTDANPVELKEVEICGNCDDQPATETVAKGAATNVSQQTYQLGQDLAMRKSDYHDPYMKDLVSNNKSNAQIAFDRQNNLAKVRQSSSPLGKTLAESEKSFEKSVDVTKKIMSGEKNLGLPNAKVSGYMKYAPALKVIGAAGIALQVAVAADNIHKSDYNQKVILKEVGGLSGALLWGSMGATYGAALGPLGALAGGIVGGALGYWVGSGEVVEDTKAILKE